MQESYVSLYYRRESVFRRTDQYSSIREGTITKKDTASCSLLEREVTDSYQLKSNLDSLRVEPLG